MQCCPSGQLIPCLIMPSRPLHVGTDWGFSSLAAKIGLHLKTVFITTTAPKWKPVSCNVWLKNWAHLPTPEDTPALGRTCWERACEPSNSIPWRCWRALWGMSGPSSSSLTHWLENHMHGLHSSRFSSQLYNLTGCPGHCTEHVDLLYSFK